MNQLMRSTINLILGFLILFMLGCSNNAPVTNNRVGAMNKESVVSVKQATVTAVKNVAILGRKGRVAGTVGSIAGSILGSSVPYAGSIIGSMIGGAVGSEADTELSKQKGLEITLQLSDGEKLVVTQLAEQQFKAGDKVELIVTDGKARVVHLKASS